MVNTVNTTEKYNVQQKGREAVYKCFLVYKFFPLWECWVPVNELMCDCLAVTCRCFTTCGLANVLFASRCFDVAPPRLRPCPSLGNDAASSPPPKPTVLQCSGDLPWCRPPPGSSTSAHRLTQPIYSITGRPTAFQWNQRESMSRWFLPPVPACFVS